MYIKKRLVFATNNRHKLDEVRAILGDYCTILSLEEIGCLEDIPETAETLEGNALMKARYVKARYGYDCFADDTGLEVNSLDNAPGVYSARYAGESKDPRANIRKLWKELQGKADWSARFRTVIALLEGDRKHLFEGIVRGHIIAEERGTGGFGYDPVFIPEGYPETFAELGDSVKNRISHRAEAVIRLKHFLENSNPKTEEKDTTER